MIKVLNFGSLNLDYVYSVPNFVRPGETLNTTDLSVYCGGKGLNQSIAMARAGIKVYHAGCIGKNDGQVLLDTLKQEGVNTSNILEINTRSGHTIIQVDEKGENSILLFAGANHKITKEHIDQVLDCFDKGDWILLQNEINNINLIMRAAADKEMRIFFNPSPINQTVHDLPLDLVDTFFLNKLEGAEITGCSTDDYKQIMMSLSSKYPKSKFILTLGEKGVCCFDGSRLVLQPAHAVDVVDTTAAGDCFTGYYIASLLKQKSTSQALSIATKAAAAAVSQKGAAASIPNLNEVIHALLS